ncbi:hypothetical protein GCM10011348_28650 [Marinobacterium nitratireducens]|uniref:Uncharacterized protein n=1 Tax=Marinobacterium nitratireducens TaxID=518897 RepID=A0A918DV95_9GAMM|nr:hypothetical protein [Marinobacterium nitratireducens]GGO83833.1 hypothetical protein GCM10011348_28650 [Marinobacterium nitratireducens]
MSQPLYREVKRLAAMLETDHPCPPDINLDNWVDQELTQLSSLHFRHRTLMKVIVSDYYGMLIEKALARSTVP